MRTKKRGMLGHVAFFCSMPQRGVARLDDSELCKPPFGYLQRLRFERRANQVKNTGTKIVEIKVAANMPPKTPVPMD